MEDIRAHGKDISSEFIPSKERKLGIFRSKLCGAKCCSRKLYYYRIHKVIIGDLGAIKQKGLNA